jgi:hypothetical protein
MCNFKHQLVTEIISICMCLLSLTENLTKDLISIFRLHIYQCFENKINLFPDKFHYKAANTTVSELND